MRLVHDTASFIMLSSLLFILSGCAGSSKNLTHEDPSAAARSRVYMTDLEAVALSEQKPSASCSVPASASKVAPSRAEGPSKEWKSYVGHANACVRARNWKNVETLGYALAKNDVDSPWGAYFLSLAAEGTGDKARALWMVDLAQKKAGGKSGLFLYQKGRVLFGLGEVSESMKSIERAVQLDAGLVEAHVFLARIYHRDTEFDQAARAYQAALKLKPNHQIATIGLAEVKLVQGKGDEAATLYSKAVVNEPSNLAAWLRLAYIQESVQKNNSNALLTYRSIKSSIDRGQIKERPQFDLLARIKVLEAAVSPSRVPASQAASAKDKAGSEKSLK